MPSGTPGYQWLYRVLAPNGEPILWSESRTEALAIQRAFGGAIEWQFAVRQGYSMEWYRGSEGNG